MKVVQVVPGITVEASGPSYSVPSLCRGLKNLGCDVSLHFLWGIPDKTFDFPVFTYKVHKFPHPYLGRSPEMLQGLMQSCKSADIIHNNSLWMLPNVYPAWAKRGTKCKLVTAPRGTLAAWSLRRHWLKKKLFGLYAQYAAMQETDMWHATCVKEYEEIRAAGYRQPVAIVPIGMDLPDLSDIRREESVCGRRKLVFFGRLHKVKAIDNLILAWERVAGKFMDWTLEIAGPDAGVRESLEKLVSEHNITRVSFIGELNGNAKYEFLASADLCVLPSYTENFGVTVAESLACGTPIIASQGTPWNGLNENGAGWWIPIGVDALENQLRHSLAMSDAELRSMGRKGCDWMKRDYNWNAIGNKMMAAYEWLLHGGVRPDCVVL